MTVSVSNGKNVQSLPARNIDFFEKLFPELGRTLKQLKPNRYQLSIQRSSGNIDLKDNGKSLYFGDMRAYAVKEVDAFTRANPQSGTYHTVNPSRIESYYGNRLFTKSIRRSISSSPLDLNTFRGYEIPDELPVLLTFGIGPHIEELLERRKIRHLVIVESDIEKLFVSLFYIDWKKVWAYFSNSNNRSIKLICQDAQGIETQYKKIRNALVGLTPLYPLCAFIYNHLANSFYLPLIDRLKNEFQLIFEAWGYFDDEINQQNNALHNLFRGSGSLLENKCEPGCFSDSQVCIVGSGRSLDKRINDLKKIQSSALIFSCGTAINSLYKYGITPDFHIELESHLATWTSSVKIIADKDPSYLKKITILASLQTHPKTCNAFSKCIFFIKDSTALNTMFSNIDQVVKHATPTCTNSGVALAMHLGIPKILLFGCDYGFNSKTEHHAKGTVYYEKDATNFIKDVVNEQENRNDFIKIKSVNGKDILTTIDYFSALKCLEYAIGEYDGKVINCSEGAKINNSHHYSTEQFNLKIKSTHNKSMYLDMIKNHSRKISNENDLRLEVSKLNYFMKEAYKKLEGRLESYGPIKNIDNAIELTSSMIRDLKDIENNYGSLIFLLRGSVWHYLYFLLSHGMAIDKSKRADFLTTWKEQFKVFLFNCVSEVESVTNKTYPDEADPWLWDAVH